ncbi:MAG TPA: phosphoribosylaminoimidazolesuccinocarboxamide synthase [Bacteroidales bacterium]|nr:phosphoribosylaminoimidazolesuccinocarboxamide synthase [Bacteroidales bacterium]HOK75925.1 phosphoribosylaminoimidazolesuccinocarboxamide synthase [Bacteroidales bacterium]HOM41102.1 phosphoribosylaminoimidazolesuccinocarboxamide synthase [Bacteroidales bacterium]HPP93691.1 phosphoribosylaminoimidazolesuccinocarboxamide synthase [Bacteroidales bacterium]HQG57176.1 phosphoribosylaminoimidazolesuccinocarboxamide synthase [Bacteroidales bacterium]
MEKDLVYRGKSKDVYNITEEPYKGKYRFVFTDRATGYVENGKIVFDPGYDTVVVDIPGKGAIACRFPTHFFKLLKEKGIPSHYIDTVKDNEMIVEPAVLLSMPAETPEFQGPVPLQNLEWTWPNILLIDEISPDVLRVCKGYSPDKDGNCLLYKECTVTSYSERKIIIKNKKQVAAADFINIFL